MSNVCRKLFAIYYFFEIFIFHRHFPPAAVPQGFKIYDFIKISHYPIFQIIFELPRQKSRATVLPNLHPVAPWPQIFLFIDVSMKQFDMHLQRHNDFMYPRTLLATKPQSSSFSSSIQIATTASLGMRRSPRGETAIEPTFGPSGRQLRLNCCEKKRQ